MSEWKTERFWQEATVEPEGQGFKVLLDGRAVKTPAKAPLIVPVEALAQQIAAEWSAQDKMIDPTSMPFTRAANAAIDKVSAQHDEVAELIAAYGDSDLLCYRAAQPEALVARQAASWDPFLDWARDEQGIELKVFTGVMHCPQPPESLARIAQITGAMNAYELTAFHDLVSLTSSFVLGLAAARQLRTADEIWEISRIDESWQEEQWGGDDEAAAATMVKRQAFVCAAQLFKIVAKPD
jgi:chaperone required for assembly of F1-ATPase